MRSLSQAGRPNVGSVPRRCRWTVGLVFLTASTIAGPAWGVSPYIHVGRQSDVLDQPRVEIELTDVGPEGEVIGIGPYGSGYGVYPYNQLLLDTGANSVLIVSSAAADLYTNGYEIEGYYQEQGVAGYSELNISAPYNMKITGTDGGSFVVPKTTDDVRIMSDQSMDLGGMPAAIGGFAGLVGMPAMVDRVTSINLEGWFDVVDYLEMPPMEVTFPVTGPSDPTPVLPADNGHRYSVALDTRMTFDPEEGLPDDAPEDAPLPVWANVPFMTAKAEYHDASGNPIVKSGDFLLDTGAQMSLLSREMAFAIGLDTDGDGTFLQENLGTLPVGGIGGTVDAELLLIDKLHLPTQEGVDLTWAPSSPEEGGLQVLVLPAGATQLPFSVFGADFLTGGTEVTIDWTTYDIAVEGNPYFEQILFDFRTFAADGNGTLYFDLNPEIDQIITPGDANDDGLVNALDVSILAGHWQDAVTGGSADGDFNGDGVVNALDVSILGAAYEDSPLPATPGDANGDGLVNALDISILAGHWQDAVTGGSADADFNGDGMVNALDISILVGHWQEGVAESTAPVPEPSSLALLLAGLLASWTAAMVRNRGGVSH